ncbi:MAG TPA: chemotaxis protein CheB [Solirubrobacterales bacterium]|nr:chemotaxis protein CheB [Solirubrobacterales bacterium]
MTTGEDREAVAPEKRVFQRDVVVVGASAGGVQALQRLVAALPPELPASILIALHLSAEATSVLHDILSRAGQLDASQAVDGERLERGRIYVAPPNRHLLVHGANVRLSAGPRENGHRPAIDPLFRSAARAYGPRVIGVVLTGTLDDGTDGLRLIKDRGGCAVVQDPEDAAYGEMPASAIAYADPQRVVPLAEMGQVIVEVIDSPLDPDAVHTNADPSEQPIDLLEAEFGPEAPDGEASLLTCPDCGGVLIEREEGKAVRFACQVGHAYSPESLVEQQGDALESALWQALRTLEERANLLNRMAKRAERRSMSETGSRMGQRADGITRHATEIRNTILRLRDGESPEAAHPRRAT